MAKQMPNRKKDDSKKKDALARNLRQNLLRRKAKSGMKSQESQLNKNDKSN